jgi:hypothetical protein
MLLLSLYIVFESVMHDPFLVENLDDSMRRSLLHPRRQVVLTSHVIVVDSNLLLGPSII